MRYFCQILSQPLTAGRDFFFMYKCDKAFWVVGPCFVNVFFDFRIGNILFEHGEQMKLPLSVDEGKGMQENCPPCFVRCNSSFSKQNV